MKQLLLSVIICFLCLSCDRINPKNEPFYCKINGKEFIPQTDNSPFGGVGSSPLKINFDKAKGSFSISALNSPNFILIIAVLQPNEDLSPKEYILGNDAKSSKSYYSYNNNTASPEDLISSSGKFIITKVEGKKIWGTFEFKTKSTKINQEFDITNGQINGVTY